MPSLKGPLVVADGAQIARKTGAGAFGAGSELPDMLGLFSPVFLFSLILRGCTSTPLHLFIERRRFVRRPPELHDSPPNSDRRRHPNFILCAYDDLGCHQRLLSRRRGNGRCRHGCGRPIQRRAARCCSRLHFPSVVDSAIPCYIITARFDDEWGLMEMETHTQPWCGGTVTVVLAQ